MMMLPGFTTIIMTQVVQPTASLGVTLATPPAQEMLVPEAVLSRQIVPLLSFRFEPRAAAVCASWNAHMNAALAREFARALYLDMSSWSVNLFGFSQLARQNPVWFARCLVGPHLRTLVVDVARLELENLALPETFFHHVFRNFVSQLAECRLPPGIPESREFTSMSNNSIPRALQAVAAGHYCVQECVRSCGSRRTARTSGRTSASGRTSTRTSARATTSSTHGASHLDLLAAKVRALHLNGRSEARLQAAQAESEAAQAESEAEIRTKIASVLSAYSELLPETQAYFATFPLILYWIELANEVSQAGRLRVERTVFFHNELFSFRTDCFLS